MPKIAIVGSCITRDLWPIRGGGAEHLLYVSRTSLPSLFAPAVAGFRPGRGLPGDLHQHEHNALLADLQKTALSRLVDVPAGARLWYDTTDIAALREAEKDRADAAQVWASAASTLLTAGYTAESVTAALTASDLTLLQHTGMLSVQLQPPGSAPAAPGGPDGQ